MEYPWSGSWQQWVVSSWMYSISDDAVLNSDQHLTLSPFSPFGPKSPSFPLSPCSGHRARKQRDDSRPSHTSWLLTRLIWLVMTHEILPTLLSLLWVPSHRPHRGDPSHPDGQTDREWDRNTDMHSSPSWFWMVTRFGLFSFRAYPISWRSSGAWRTFITLSHKSVL